MDLGSNLLFNRLFDLDSMSGLRAKEVARSILGAADAVKEEYKFLFPEACRSKLKNNCTVKNARYSTDSSADFTILYDLTSFDMANSWQSKSYYFKY